MYETLNFNSDLKYTTNIPIWEQVRAQLEAKLYERHTRIEPERAWKRIVFSYQRPNQAWMQVKAESFQVQKCRLCKVGAYFPIN